MIKYPIDIMMAEFETKQYKRDSETNLILKEDTLKEQLLPLLTSIDNDITQLVAPKERKDMSFAYHHLSMHHTLTREIEDDILLELNEEGFRDTFGIPCRETFDELESTHHRFFQPYLADIARKQVALSVLHQIRCGGHPTEPHTTLDILLHDVIDDMPVVQDLGQNDGNRFKIQFSKYIRNIYWQDIPDIQYRETFVTAAGLTKEILQDFDHYDPRTGLAIARISAVNFMEREMIK